MKFTPHDDFGDSADTKGLDVLTAGFFALSGAWCSRNPMHGKPGFIPVEVLADISPEWERLAEVLARRGLWRKARDGYQFVGWRQRWDGTAQAADSAPVAAASPAAPVRRSPPPGRPRQVVYRDKALRDALRARDGDRCRFCTVPVRWGRGRARDSGTWELADQGGEMDGANIVVACMGCAGARRKGADIVLAAPGTVIGRDGSPFPGDGSGTVTEAISPAQNRHANRHSRAYLIDQSQSSAGVLQSGVKSKSRARNGRDGSELGRDASSGPKRHDGGDGSGDASQPAPFSEADVIEAITDEFLKAHGQVVIRGQALHAKGVIDQRAARNKTRIATLGYYRTSVRDEADTRRLLPPDPADQSWHEILTDPEWDGIRPGKATTKKHEFKLDHFDASRNAEICACGLPRTNKRHPQSEARTA